METGPDKAPAARSPRRVKANDPSLAAARQPAAPPPASSAPPALTTGWHQLEDAVYHTDPCPLPSLSSSIANMVINKSLMHAWRAHPRSPLFEASVFGSAVDRGSAAHSVLFGGREIEAVEAEDYRTAAAP